MRTDTTRGTFDYTYLSLGAGVQSSALLVLAVTDDRVPMPNAAIFADTGDEPAYVYEHLDALEAFVGPLFPIYRVSKGRLSEWVVDRQRAGKRFVNVPLFTKDPETGRVGMLRRQCTREFKIEPIEKKVRTLLGYRPRQHVRESVRAMLGISVDEATRMKASRTRWVTNAYPLVDLGISRAACVDIVTGAGLPEPRKSSCVYCPYHSDAYWRELKDRHPEAFAQAVAFDESVRHMTMRGRRSPAYVHRSCVPLSDIDFDAGLHPDLFAEDCAGVCGV